MLITKLVVSFCKGSGSSFNTKLRFLELCVLCDVLCRLVVDGNVFLLILIVVIIHAWFSVFHVWMGNYTCCWCYLVL